MCHPPVRRLRRTVSALCLVLLAGCAGASATDTTIEVADARVTVPAGPNAAAYMTLTNTGDADARLIGADTDAATSAEIHETTDEGGQMSMSPVDGVDVPAGGEATLEPGGLHVMLLGADDGLAEGDTVTVTLQFDGAQDVTVDATVVPLVDEGAGAHSDMDMSSEMAMPSEG